MIYHVSLPDDVQPRSREEPREVLLRLYGQKYNENETSTSDKVLVCFYSLHAISHAFMLILSFIQVLENVIFTLLSERGLGPRLYGVFPEGRLEEFIKVCWERGLTLVTSFSLKRMFSFSGAVHDPGGGPRSPALQPDCEEDG